MRKLFALLMLAVLVSGCGTLERLKERRDSKHTSNTSTVGKTTSNTTTKVVEKADTTIKVKKDSVVAVRPLEDLLQGKPIVATDGNNTVRVTYDPETEIIRAVGITEAHEIPVEIERITTVENETDEVVKSDEAVVNKEMVRTEETDRGSSGFQWGFMVAILAIIVLVALYLVYRRPRDGLIR